MKIAKLAGALALLLCPTWASADPISFFYDFRNTVVLAHVEDASGYSRNTDHDYQSDSLQSSASAATALSTGTAFASQMSSLTDPTHLWGSGLASTSFDTAQIGDVSAASQYVVGLHLEQPYTFAFDGRFDVTGRSPFDPTGPNVQGFWQVQLHQGSLLTINQLSYDAAHFTQSGTLFPGDWYLLVEGAATGYTPRAAVASSASQFAFTLDLAPVAPSPSPTPEPASMLLLGTGVAGLVAARRRR